MYMCVCGGGEQRGMEWTMTHLQVVAGSCPENVFVFGKIICILENWHTRRVRVSFSLTGNKVAMVL